MASEVNIVNLAAARLGISSRVSSISPPDGSTLATYAAEFYPMCRDTLLEMKDWPFAISREVMTELSGVTIPPPFTNAYAMPSKAVVPIDIRRSDASDDSKPNLLKWEMLADGTRVVFTDTDLAVMRYKIASVNPTKFTPLFVDALAWYLAIQLAGPLIGGDQKRVDYCTKMFAYTIGISVESVFNAINAPVEHVPEWLGAR